MRNMILLVILLAAGILATGIYTLCQYATNLIAFYL